MSAPRAGIILQARFASQRLPGKALASIAGRPILEHCLLRLLASESAPVVLATTAGPEDDALAEVASGIGVPVFRGDSADVLGRYVSCAAHFRFDLVIRATGDNPGVDIDAPARILAGLQYTDADYVREDGLPYGAAVEGVRADALAQAAMLAGEPSDREHVTTFIRRRTDLFRVLEQVAPAAVRRPDVRLTVDTADDLLLVQHLYRQARVEMPSLVDLIAASDQMPRQSVA